MDELYAIGILLAVVGIVFWRLPDTEIKHDSKYKTRRLLNWLPLGLTYAFLYMGRYNLKVSKFAFESMRGPDGSPLMGNDAFGIIFGVGTIFYGCSFLINGPLTDKLGGRFSILVGAAGSCVMNLLMGLVSISLIQHGPGYDYLSKNFVFVFSALYGINMYFQSFGAVAIVKVNAHWFHVRERGVFGAIFGILISLGIYFAFDLSSKIQAAPALGNFLPTDTSIVAADSVLRTKTPALPWVFLTPTIMLAIFWVIDFFVVRNTPEETGLPGISTGDASEGDEGPQLGAIEVFKLMLQNPIILTIAAIEFCSGFLRQAIMQWFRTYAKQTNEMLHIKTSFVYEHWGLLLCCAGIMGGVFAGVISDHFFKSRRGPVAGILYGIMLIGSIVLCFTYQNPVVVGWLVIFMSMAVIGVHGMLSGTASMDFGGKKNVGIAVGIIDGFVYLGTAVMSFTYAVMLPKEELDAAGKIVGEATKPDNWFAWPAAMVPMALAGTLLATRVWNAKPKGKSSAKSGPTSISRQMRRQMERAEKKKQKKEKDS